MLRRCSSLAEITRSFARSSGQGLAAVALLLGAGCGFDSRELSVQGAAGASAQAETTEPEPAGETVGPAPRGESDGAPLDDSEGAGTERTVMPALEPAPEVASAAGAAADGSCDGGDCACALDPASCPPPQPECDGCLIAAECVASGTLQPGNPCLVCDPARSGSAWSAANGPCDDGLFCTVDDACQGGVCLGGAARDCEDEATCNGVSVCDEASDACTAQSSQCGPNAVCIVATDSCESTCAGCVIGGSCVAAGSEAAGNPCLICDPARSQAAYSPAPGKLCGAAATACSGQDTCSAAGVCQPNHLAAGTQCGDRASSACNDPDTCDGAGACQARLRPNGTPCDDGLFCSTGDRCQGGLCGPTGSLTCDSGQTCNEASDSCQFVCAPRPAGIISWWPGDNTSDIVGNAQGQATDVAIVPGLVGRALDFNGSTSGINLGDRGLLANRTDSLTIEGWLSYRGSTGQAAENVFTTNYACGAQNVSVVVTEGRLGFFLRDAERALAFAEALTPLPVAAGGAQNFHHFAAVRNAAAQRVLLYIDGQDVSSDAQQLRPGGVVDTTAATLALAADDFIGRRFPCPDSSNFNGAIDELTIYNRALSPAEIRSIVSARQAGKCR